MQIIKDEIFKENFQVVLQYIARDSKIQASKFNAGLASKINKIPYMPYKFRRSYYYEDEKIRDMIFKGYTIPYLVDEVNDVIVILDIFKYSYRDFS